MSLLELTVLHELGTSKKLRTCQANYLKVNDNNRLQKIEESCFSQIVRNTYTFIFFGSIACKEFLQFAHHFQHCRYHLSGSVLEDHRITKPIKPTAAQQSPPHHLTD